MATNTRKLSDFLAEGEGDTFGDLPVENPHIKPGTLYPAVNGMINYDSQNTFTDSAGTPKTCLLYTSPSPRDGLLSRLPSSA